MPSTTCLSCGGEMPASSATCPACGTRRRPRLPGPPFWGPAGARRTSAAVGLLLAVALSAFLAWHIATHGKGEPAANVVPVNLRGASK